MVGAFLKRLCARLMDFRFLSVLLPEYAVGAAVKNTRLRIPHIKKAPSKMVGAFLKRLCARLMDFRFLSVLLPEYAVGAAVKSSRA